MCVCLCVCVHARACMCVCVSMCEGTADLCNFIPKGANHKMFIFKTFRKYGMYVHT